MVTKREQKLNDAASSWHRCYKALKSEVRRLDGEWLVKLTREQVPWSLSTAREQIEADVLRDWSSRAKKYLHGHEDRRRGSICLDLLYIFSDESTPALHRIEHATRKVLSCHDPSSFKIASAVLNKSRGTIWELLALTVLLRNWAVGPFPEALGSQQKIGLPVHLDGHRLFLWYAPGEIKPPNLSEGSIRAIRPDFILTRSQDELTQGVLSSGEVAALIECKSHGFKSSHFYELWGQVRHVQAQLGILLVWADAISAGSREGDYLLQEAVDEDTRLAALGSPEYGDQDRGRSRDERWNAWFRALTGQVKHIVA